MSNKLAIEGETGVATNLRLWVTKRWADAKWKEQWEDIDSMMHGAGIAIYMVDATLGNEMWDLSRQARARADYNEVDEVAA